MSLLLLLACGDRQLPIGEYTLDWGPAGAPLADARPVDDLTGDWVLCVDEDCESPRGSFRVSADGTARYLIQHGRSTFCIAAVGSSLRWTYRDSVLTFEEDPPRAPPRAPGRVRVENLANVVVWTPLSTGEEALTVGNVSVGTSLFGYRNPPDPLLQTCKPNTVDLR